MATKNVVPNADGEGSLGTSAKKWGNIYADEINLGSGGALPTAESIAAADNRRAFAGGVALATAGEISMAAGANDFGTGDFTISIDRLHLDDYTPATAGELYSTHSTGNNRLQVTILTTGVWRLTFTDNAAAATNYDITPTTALPDYPVSVSIGADRSGNATLYVDGTANGTASIAAASAIDIGSGNTNSGELLTDANLSGIVEGAASFNRALSASEAAELAEIGIGAWLAKYPEDQWGGEELKGSGNWSEFSSTWPSFTGADNDGFTGTTGDSGTFRAKIDLSRDIEAGETVAATLTVDSLSGLGFSVSLGDGSTVSSTSNSVSINSTGTHTVYVTATGTSDRLMVRTFNSEITVTISETLTIKAGTLAAYPMDEGNGRQLRDLSGRYDVLLSVTGYQHMQPKTEGFVRVKGADANPSIMMLEDSDIIPADAVWTQIIAEERIVDIANTAQDLLDRRVRLADSTGDLIIQRSDGTDHTTLGTVTAPTSLDDIDAEVHYKQQAR